MATKQSTVDYLLEQISSAGSISAKKMFGEYALYLNGKVIGLICDDQFYLKPTKAGQSIICEITEGVPYKGAKPHFLIEADQWENEEWMHGYQLPDHQKPTGDFLFWEFDDEQIYENFHSWSFVFLDERMRVNLKRANGGAKNVRFYGNDIERYRCRNRNL